MSLKLLKQSVEIIEEDLQQKKSKKDKQTSNANRKHKAIIRYSGEEHVSKNKKRLQDVKYELNSSNKRAEDNIQRLLALSMNAVVVKDAEKIVQRAHRGRYVEKIIPKVEQESIFTDEDFRKFEEEYFNS